MSIFEKAFEKAGKGNAGEQEDQLFDSRDDLVNIPESVGDDEVESVLAEQADSGVWSENEPQPAVSGRQVTLDLSRLQEAGRSKDPKRTRISGNHWLVEDLSSMFIK